MVTHFALFTDAQGGRGINRGDVKPARSTTPHYKAADLYCGVEQNIMNSALYITASLGGILQIRRLILCRSQWNIVDAPCYIMPLLTAYYEHALYFSRV